MKVLVTGTAGFIGFHLAKKLLERGDEVVGLDNINDYYDVNLKYGRLKELGIEKEDIVEKQFTTSSFFPKHKFIKLDLADREGMEKLFKEEEFDAVMHLAAQAGVRYSIENPHAYIDSNIVGFMNILEGCRHSGVKNLAFASSSSVYGLNKSQPFKTSDHTDHPVSLYAATKKSSEMMAHTYAHLYGIQVTGLRFFTVYGPWGRPDMAPMLFTDAILNDRPIKVFNHGKMSRDFTYIDDIVDGIIKVIDNPASSNPDWNAEKPTPESSSAPYKIYNIGNNAPVALMEFIETIENTLGKVAEKNFMPMQDGDVVSTYADGSGLKNDFGYKPYTKLADGISKFVNWYKEFYSSKENRLVSICIPSYNRPTELRRLLNSIDTQQEEKIEILICEDKSPKREEVNLEVNEFISNSKYEIKYYENEINLGYDKNLKELIQKASGNFIVFMGDDDEFIPDSLDKLIEFLEINNEVGYVLKSHQQIFKDGRIEKFRYFDGNQFFKAGEDTYIELYRKSVFISGFTINRAYVQDLLIDDFDGALLFQLYLLAEVALKYECAYFDTPLTQAREEGIPFFGTSDSEKDLYTPGTITIENSINFLKGFFKITTFIDEKYNLNSTEKIKIDMSKYFYPSLAIQREKGIKDFSKYVKELNGIGFNITIYYYIYVAALVMFGKKNCDNIIMFLKKTLGKTPKL